MSGRDGREKGRRGKEKKEIKVKETGKKIIRKERERNGWFLGPGQTRERKGEMEEVGGTRERKGTKGKEETE